MGVHNLNNFFSSSDLIPMASPVNLATGANPGDRINMKEYHGVLLALLKGIGTAGDNPVFTLLQHDAPTGGNSKALNISEIYARLDAADVGTVGSFTKLTQAPAATFTIPNSAEKQGVIAAQVLATDLDSANGFNYISLSIPDTGTNSQLGATFAIPFGKRYEGSATDVTV